MRVMKNIFKKNPKNYKILEKPKNNVKISFEIVFLTMWCHMAICCNLFLVPRGTYSTFQGNLLSSAFQFILYFYVVYEVLKEREKY